MIQLKLRDTRPIYIQIIDGLKEQICAGISLYFWHFLCLFDELIYTAVA